MAIFFRKIFFVNIENIWENHATSPFCIDCLTWTLSAIYMDSKQNNISYFNVVFFTYIFFIIFPFFISFYPIYPFLLTMRLFLLSLIVLFKFPLFFFLKISFIKKFFLFLFSSPILIIFSLSLSIQKFLPTLFPILFF
jgi:hypothetical protein